MSQEIVKTVQRGDGEDRMESKRFLEEVTVFGELEHVGSVQVGRRTWGYDSPSARL